MNDHSGGGVPRIKLSSPDFDEWKEKRMKKGRVLGIGIAINEEWSEIPTWARPIDAVMLGPNAIIWPQNTAWVN